MSITSRDVIFLVSNICVRSQIYATKLDSSPKVFVDLIFITFSTFSTKKTTGEQLGEQGRKVEPSYADNVLS